MLGVSALQRSIILHSDALINNLRRFHFAVRAYDGFGCGDISNNKTVTFGDECTEDQLNPDYQHSLNFKVVGESFKSHASDVGPTQVEEERLDKWNGTTMRLKHILVHWPNPRWLLPLTTTQCMRGAHTHTHLSR